MDERRSRPSHSKIVDYWKDKYISDKFEIINYKEEGAIPVINDWGEPECWACGLFNYKIYEDDNYEKYRLSDRVFKIWDLNASKSLLQRAHIIPKMCGGDDSISNYFLLCKKCHEESPDHMDNRFFFAYIRYCKKESQAIRRSRNEEIEKAVYCLANEMNKNILTFNKGRQLVGENIKKVGFHSTQSALFTIAAVIVDGMDTLNPKTLTEDEIRTITREYERYGIVWNYNK